MVLPAQLFAAVGQTSESDCQRRKQDGRKVNPALAHFIDGVASKQNLNKSNAKSAAQRLSTENK